MRTFYLSILCAVLASCTNSPVQTNSQIYNSNEGTFVISLPNEMHRFKTDRIEDSFDTNPTNNPNSKTDYRLYFASSPTSCSSDFIGSSQVSDLHNSKWGRVDYFDSPDIINGPLREELPCQPPEISWQLDANGNIIGPALDRGEAYVFCSEKSGKRVLICLSQMTDEPQLAEQIFSTFRWLD